MNIMKSKIQIPPDTFFTPVSSPWEISLRLKVGIECIFINVRMMAVMCIPVYRLTRDADAPYPLSPSLLPTRSRLSHNTMAEQMSEVTVEAAAGLPPPSSQPPPLHPVAQPYVTPHYYTSLKHFQVCTRQKPLLSKHPPLCIYMPIPY